MIAGGALGLAALAVAIDHTKQRVPTPVSLSDEGSRQVDDILDEASPCGLGNPCALNLAPSGLGNPCALNLSPCSLD